jgi:hypothetical protein
MRSSTRALDDDEGPDRPRDAATMRPATAPEAVVDGPMLCRLRIWTEAEWDALPAGRRPRRCVHAPGLGWVGAVPDECLN